MSKAAEQQSGFTTDNTEGRMPDWFPHIWIHHINTWCGEYLANRNIYLFTVCIRPDPAKVFSAWFMVLNLGIGIDIQTFGNVRRRRLRRHARILELLKESEEKSTQRRRDHAEAQRGVDDE